MRNTTTPFVVAVLHTCIIPYDTPKTILSAKGPHFIADLFKTLCYLLGIQMETTTEYHPQPNGQTER